MTRSTAWTLAFLAAACALVAEVGPSAAFDLATFDRTATATITTDAAGYNAISSSSSPAWTCNGGSLSTQCKQTVIITNKGSTGQAYRVMRETATASRVTDWALGGVTAVEASDVSGGASPWTSWTAEKSVGQAAMLIMNISGCTLGCSKSYYNFTVEGQKANILDFNETRIMVIVEY